MYKDKFCQGGSRLFYPEGLNDPLDFGAFNDVFSSGKPCTTLSIASEQAILLNENKLKLVELATRLTKVEQQSKSSAALTAFEKQKFYNGLQVLGALPDLRSK